MEADDVLITSFVTRVSGEDSSAGSLSFTEVLLATSISTKGRPCLTISPTAI